MAHAHPAALGLHRSWPWSLLSDLLPVSGEHATLDFPPYPAWGAPEEAAWSRFDVQFFDPLVRHQPIIAFVMLFLCAFAFLGFWGYSFLAYSRKRRVMQGVAPPQRETIPVERRTMDCYVMCGSLEHSLPHLQKGKAVAGGLGKVMDLVARHHPTRITMVHPMLKQGERLDYEIHAERDEQEPLRVRVDGVVEEVRVFWQPGAPAGGPGGSDVDFLLLSHPLFETRTKETIYPNPMTRRKVLRFYSLWNQAMGALVARNKPDLLHTPDFHTAVAPWYAIRDCPWLRIVLVLHNAEYQGSMATSMLFGEKLQKVAEIWNLPPQMVSKHLVFEGRFNMLKAGIDFVMEKQKGRGVYAVSSHYAEEVTATYSLLWKVRRVGGLDNPMLEEERAQLTESLVETKLKAKLDIQRQFGLREDPEARIFVSLGRLVRQKGVDIVADVADWLLSNPAFPNAQLIVIGPVADGYGVYAKERLLVTAAKPEFQGRLFIRPEFMAVPSCLKFAADFCLMPSRDEPFGYVDIEFAWHGAVMVGAEAGGLGKVPGFYFIAQNRENLDHLREKLKDVITEAMEASPQQLEQMAEQALRCTFPLDEWQMKLTAAYREVLARAPPRRPAAGAAGVDIELPHPGTFTPYREEVERAQRWAARVAVVARVPALMEEIVMGARGQGPEARRPLLSFRQDNSFDEAPDEFLTQELSEEELAVRVQEKVQRHPRMYIDEMVETIGSEVDLEREADGSLPKWLLGRTFGQARVHLLVVCGYLVGPLVDSFVIVFATEWSVRYGSVSGHLGTMPLRWDSVTGLCAIFMMLSSVAYLCGAIFWAALTKYLAPRTVMGANLLLHCLFVVATFASKGSFSLACQFVFLHGLVTSGSLLFLAFSFMMSIKADLSVAAIRMGVIETIRYAIVWLPTTFLLLCSPTSFAGTVDNPLPSSVKLVLVPIGLLAVVFTLVPGVLLFFAPGPYRDDRFPGWEIPLLFKRWSFVILGWADCSAALYLFPSLSYMTWWLAQGWSATGLGWLGVFITLMLGAGFVSWALALSRASKHSLTFLGGAAVLLLPPAMIRAVAQGEVSTARVQDKSVLTFLLCVATLLLEGIRQSAQWTAKIKVLNSRWRLLSYGSVLVACQSFFSFLSPLVAFGTGQSLPASVSLGTTDPQHMSFLAMVTIVPGAMLVSWIQVAAGPFILKDLGVPRKPESFRRNCCTRCLTSPALVALGITWVLVALLSSDYKALISKPMVYFPTFRCPGEWTPQEVEGLRSVCTAVASERGGAFERNANGQITTARYNCLQLMQQTGGNTFALVAGPGEADNECRVMVCEVPLEYHSPARIDAPWDQDREVWSRRCPQTKIARNIVGTHLMEWNWTYIGEECKNRLGPEGWNFVQVSPPAEHVLGPSWSTKYQPVSYKLDSRSGSEAEFREMVKKCRAAGVSIMVDFIVNHMAASVPPKGMTRAVNDTKDPECGINYDCRGWNGSWYGSREYGSDDADPRMNKFRRDAFHHYTGNDRANCGLDTFAAAKDPTPMNILNDFALCDMSGCVDLHTELPSTQSMIQRYLMRLTDAGVTMLRVDASPAVYSQSLAYIVQPFPWEFVVQEVLGANSPFNSKAMDVPGRLEVSSILDSTFGSEMQNLARAGPAAFATLPAYMAGSRTEVPFTPPPEKALVYIDNHDSQRAGDRPNYKWGTGYRTFQHFMLAYPWGNAVRLMSGYHFDEAQQGPPGVGDGLVGYPSKVECRPPPETFPASRAWLAQKPDWVCEHQWPGVGPLVRLRRLIGKDQPVWNVVMDTTQGAFAFSLGGVAFFAFTFPTYLPTEDTTDLLSLDEPSEMPRSLAASLLGNASEGGTLLETDVNVGAFDWSLVGRQSGLAAGAYCNVASLSGRLPTPAEWPASSAKAQCGKDRQVIVGPWGIITSGVAKRGHTVAIHKFYTA